MYIYTDTSIYACYKVRVQFQDYSICSYTVCNDILLALSNLHLFNVPQRKDPKSLIFPNSLQDGPVR